MSCKINSVQLVRWKYFLANYSGSSQGTTYKWPATVQRRKWKKVRILTVSDVVSEELTGSPEKRISLQPDLILSCGDLPPEYLTALRQRFDVPLLYILGNHDLRFKQSPPSGCHCIDKKIVTFENLRIIGLSGSRWYNGGENQFTEFEMAAFVRKMRFSIWRKGSPDIIITHAPPRYIHDAEDPCHKGFKNFNKLIERYSPNYFFHGHIHRHFENDSDRISQVNTTKVINSYGFYVLEI